MCARNSLEVPATPEVRAHTKPLRVWAPRATELTLYVAGASVPMHPGEHGWWTAERSLMPGDRYGYVVDGAGPFPDPRSLFQPDGVHALSEWIDHAAFEWTDGSFQAPPLSSAVVYELHVGTFSERGTFEGAIERLPHLVNLGITHVEIMPVAEFAGMRGWGYDGVDLYAPHHAYGHPNGLKRLVDACHARGLAVLLDVVYNHLGPTGNYLSRFGPYFTDRHKTPWGEGVNYDGAGSDEVRRFVCDNALMWLRDYHMDGLRIDAVHAMHDNSATHILEQLASEVRQLEATAGRHLVLIAESDLNDPRVVRPPEVGGYGLDAQWSDDFHHALHAVLTGERTGYYADFGTLADLATALRHAFVYAGRHSRHRGRVHGRSAEGVPASRFIVAAQNHDQVGNRARGERLSQLVSPGKLKIAAALLLTSPFVPMLFQGEEWAASTPFLYFTAHEDAELGRLVRDGRRREFAAFGWNPLDVPDPQAPSTFERSRLLWREIADGVHAELLSWHKSLLALRRSTPELVDGSLEGCRVEVTEPGLVRVERGPIRVLCNLGSTDVSMTVPEDAQVVLASDPGARRGAGTAILPRESVLVTSLRR